MNICVIVSGSVAAYKAAALISMLRKEGHAVRVLATKAALRFVGRASFEALSGQPIYTSLWKKREDITHISLRDWADLFLFAPATANRINRLAAGLAEDLLGAVFLANNFEKPFWIAPAMNTGMLSHPATQAALEQLESWGCRILHGSSGRLACGDYGDGRMIESEAIGALVRELQRQQTQSATEAVLGRPFKVLITGGAMREILDDVRYIQNTSSGRTASAITQAFLNLGCQVVWLCHQSAETSGCEGATLRPYDTYEDLEALLKTQLSSSTPDLIIHAAAVSDYQFQRFPGKLSSSEELHITARPRAKLLDVIDSLKAERSAVVAFKLSSSGSQTEGLNAAHRILHEHAVQAVIWNEVSGVSDTRHEFMLINQAGTASIGRTNRELADALCSYFLPPAILEQANSEIEGDE